ncbi:uncharacterized protein PADG_00164 [Paracoccidioides brasiliensis Pb18]|uniref:Uncharacterized protein n=2 Tax=Paracoccidioides brasiliensis TaxID=121759 RepID=C1FZX4_PARBD|nr:uncharacterized protein PADG_00164 [Paracoccidioides brasiliensis Pb18]EEH43875.2 hypothetical protein PADG_00164 [Paracoccidioides brasiliensis Pb18]ODH13229.1 hypothetical protein ACO22_07466 [Paracoccidioides brasiliensis]ODH47014.1 hypothetical protein GX48_06896 [Paracoccidioides brasiliensis]
MFSAVCALWHCGTGLLGSRHYAFPLPLIARLKISHVYIVDANFIGAGAGVEPVDAADSADAADKAVRLSARPSPTEARRLVRLDPAPGASDRARPRPGARLDSTSD